MFFLDHKTGNKSLTVGLVYLSVVLYIISIILYSAEVVDFVDHAIYFYTLNVGLYLGRRIPIEKFAKQYKSDEELFDKMNKKLKGE